MGQRTGHPADVVRGPATNLRQLITAFDRLHLHEDLLFGDNGYVYARWTLRGVHAGDHVGIAPTHREIAVQTSEVYAVAGAKVTESWVYAEMTSLFDQTRESALMTSADGVDAAGPVGP